MEHGPPWACISAADCSPCNLLTGWRRNLGLHQEQTGNTPYPNKQTSANKWYAKTPASSSLGCCTSEYLGLQSSSGTHMWVPTVTTGAFSRITSKINYLHSYACLRLCFLANPNQHRFHVTSQLLIICGCLEHSIMKISKAASGFNRNERNNSNVGHHHGKASSGPLIRMMKDYIWAYQTKSSY